MRDRGQRFKDSDRIAAFNALAKLCGIELRRRSQKWFVRAITLLFGWLVLEGISDALLQRASPVGRWIAQQDSMAWIATVWLIAVAALRCAYVFMKVSDGANPSAVLLAGGAILFAAIRTLLWRRARYG